jgi:DNA-binding NarL/FixJ family response regulator
MPAAVVIGPELQQKKNLVPRSKPRTLVVDDSLTILHAICALLEHHEVVNVVGRAESGEETVDATLALGPDLVLMDADMPGMSGLRASLVLSQIRPETRVVLMTMDKSPEVRRAGSSCGAYAVIYKPRFLSELAELLHQDSTGSRLRGEAAQGTGTIMGEAS